MSGKVQINNLLDQVISEAIENHPSNKLARGREKPFSTDSIINKLGISRQTFNRLRKNPENFKLGDLIKLSGILNVDEDKLIEASRNILKRDLQERNRVVHTFHQVTEFSKDELKTLKRLSQRNIDECHLRNDIEKDLLKHYYELHQKILLLIDFSK